MSEFLKISNNIGSAGVGRALPPNIQFDAKDNVLRARFRGPFTGLDTTSSIANMDLMALRIADNCNIEEDGSINKRKGFTSLLSSPWGSRVITQGVEHVTSSGNRAYVVFGHTNTSTTGAFGLAGADFNTSISNLLTGQSTNRPTIFQFDDRIFWYNGDAPKVYNNGLTASPQQIGITPPPIEPGNSAVIDGELTVGGVYTYAYTYYNSITGAESAPSELETFPAALPDPQNGWRVLVWPGDANTADTIRLYRTTAGGSTLLLDVEVPISTTHIDSVQPDSGLGRELDFENHRHIIFGTPRYAWVAESRVIATGMSENLNRAIISSITAAGPMPESFPTKNFVDCQSSRGNADINLGGGIAGDTVVVLKQNSIGRIEKLGADTATEYEDPVVFTYREISRAVTGISHFAACNVLSEYVWLGRDNIYATDGVNVRSIADKIQNDIKGFKFNYDDSFSAFNDLEEKRVYFAVKSTAGLTWPDIILVGHYSNYPEFYWTVYKAGTNVSTHPGIQPGCFFELIQYHDREHRIVFGNTTNNGQIYELNSGDSDDGLGIFFRVRFAPVSFGLEEEEKLYVEDQIRAIGNGSNYSLTAQSLYNYLLTETDQQNLSLISSGSLWGGFLWGSGLWGANTPLKLRHFSHMKAYSKQLQIQQTGFNEPLIVYSFELMARPTAWKA